jgi:DNA polymerase-1
MSKPHKKILALLDVHAIVHRAYHALPNFMSSKGEPTGALYGLCTMLLKMVKDIKPDYIVACYDLPEKTLRHEVYQDYKAGRKQADEALVAQLERSKDIFKAFSIPMYSSPGFEADDMLGTIVSQSKDLDIVIVSGDMDTMQLIEGERVKVYTLKKGIKETIVYDEAAVLERFGFGPKLLPDFKGLCGDPSDNIIGVPGIGDKTARELITKIGSIEDIYKKIDTLEKAGIKPRVVSLLKEHEEEALFSKMLATIRTDAPIFFQIPAKPWPEDVDMNAIQKLFGELEFRTLGFKVAETLSLDLPASSLSASPEEIYETGLMLWVVDSNKTNPTLDDILGFTRTNDLEGAKKYLQKIIAEEHLNFVFEKIEKPLIPIIADIKKIGIMIDRPRLHELSLKYHNELSSLEKKIWNLTGKEFNISSPKQLADILFVTMGLKIKGQRKTAGGKYSTKESELEKLRGEHPIASLVLEYRELSKLLGTYIDALPKQVEKDGRLHADFLQMGASTGRMASQNPNLQNIPNRTDLGREIRKSFVSDKGWKLVSFDYSQIELRIAAFLSKDKKLMEIFKTGLDVHTAVAMEVFGEASKEARTRAKTINFGVMYGMGVLALKQNLGTTKEDAKRFLDEYFQKFSGLAEYLEKVKRETAAKGYTETYFGRRRYFPEIRSKLPFMRASAERMTINAPIQGTEADIIKLAMIEIDNFVKKHKIKRDVRLLLQVHDELVYEIKEDLVTQVSPEIQKIMENIIPPKDISGIKIATNALVGDNWGEMKEI